MSHFAFNDKEKRNEHTKNETKFLPKFGCTIRKYVRLGRGTRWMAKHRE